MRLRSRISGWEAAGLDHRLGSESFASTEAKSLRCFAGSKILPQVANLLAYLGIGEFEFIQSHWIEPIYSEKSLTREHNSLCRPRA